MPSSFYAQVWTGGVLDVRVKLSVLAAAMSGFASINVALNIAPDTEEVQVFDFAAPVS